MTPILKVKPGVKLRGLKPEMCVALDAVPVVFARFGHDCWLTCAVEPRESGLHPSGLALDFDSSTNLPEETGNEIAVRVRGYVGPEFNCIWHGPRWHLHLEHDPKD